MKLSITSQHPTKQSMVLVLRGVLDYATAPVLQAGISAATARQPPPQTIVVDLSSVESIDDAGVGTLVVGNRLCRQIGIDLAVHNPSPLIQRQLGLTRTPRHGQHSRVASAGSG